MISNAPEFLANLCAAIYEEDPIGFDVKRAWRSAAAAMEGLAAGFRGIEISGKIIVPATEGLMVVIDKKHLRSTFTYEGEKNDHHR